MQTRRPRILVIDGDEQVRFGLAAALGRVGYQTDTARDGVEGRRSARRIRPDLIILDVVLPGRSGIDIVAELRRRGDIVPVLILSARNRTEDKVLGLDAGADDYLTKPFEPAELVARVAALLRRRRREETGNGVERVGAIELDRERRRVAVCGRPVELNAREFDLLCFLADPPARPRSRREILDRVWGWGFEGSERTVDNFIVALRRKLEDDPARPRRIITVRGFGYRLDDRRGL